MLNMAAIIATMSADGQAVMSDIFNSLLKDHKPKHDQMISNYKRYQASHSPDGVPVFTRKFTDANKINRKLNDAFDADIIDVKLGYMLGNQLLYVMDKSAYTTGETLNQGAYDVAQKFLTDFNLANNSEDIDGETLKMAAICGYASRLLYIDSAGQTAIMNVPPWECIYVRDGSVNESQYAMRYYEMMEGEKLRVMVEWYDPKMVSFYISTDDTKNKPAGQDADMIFRPYVKDGKSSMPHMFTGIPLIQFANNEEHQGDCDKIYSLIDAYDADLSDVSSELEQFRLAYMAFYGFAPDQETIDRAKKTGAFGMPDEHCKIEFITKNLNDLVIENHLNRLEDNIYKFGKSVNFGDEAFAGNISGIAMKFKMFGLESKCITSERKFTVALRTQYKILSTAWKVKGSTIDYLNIAFVWTRNFPLNLLDEAETTVKLKGMVSEKTRLGLLSFVDDPEKEIAAMEEEAAKIDFNEPQLDEDGNPIVPGVVTPDEVLFR